ncbi:Dead/deah box helicase domain protein [Priestia megaterium WSH-002]|uniref:Dead/deah box helicase domain protein n=1 Tax=Priestia megaterium (strain WSH-002) TaxID=1006007 RepID=A0A8D4BJK9_PRIMW|nr:DEAD/DEAH box helicase [Priestia megaterium]AEN89213.1 Dead/deah box helicase domain protein [Priestia megaterium WSH-002]
MGFFDRKMKEYSVKTKEITINSIDIFNKSLIQKPGYDFLRGNQTDFLKQWESRRNERDIVGLMDTGSGKTLTGLLMLYSKLKEGVGPAVYLCPDNQLVEQVYQQASLYGIPVCKFEQTTGYQQFPLEFENSEAILITNFDKLFNGRSVFGVIGNDREIKEIGALLIDDAHECVKKARQKASIKINRYENKKLFTDLGNLFYDGLNKQGRAALSSIEKGEASVIKQIPYWDWNNKVSSVVKLLEENNNKENSDIFFNSNLILDELENCECFISGTTIEITPLMIPYHKIPSYNKAKHRFILSATLNNGFSLISDLGVDESGVKNPIKVNTINLGERLILAPKRYNKEVTDDEIRQLCFEYAKTINVVVIVPNNKKSEIWTNMGAELLSSDNVVEEISKLKVEKKGRVCVVQNRYDGMDLLDEACRLLVIDGMPTKESLKEKIEMQYRENSMLVNMKKAQTIEQGLGRGVRSGTDHCVTILMGDDLLSFIGKKNNKPLFSPVIQSQLEFGVNLVTGEEVLEKHTAIDYMKEAIKECLEATDSWRTFHKQLVNSADDEYQSSNFNDLFELSALENILFEAKRKEDLSSIDNFMGKILSLVSGSKDEGWYYQIYAQLIHSMDSTRASDLQIKAKELNASLLKPLSFIRSRKVKNYGSQIPNFKRKVAEFDRGTDLVIYVNDLFSTLEYSPNILYKDFESSIQKLGDFLGFESTCPDSEYNDGPDNFWRTENFDFVIECKNNSLNNISRDEANQMTASIRWYKELYTENDRMVGLILHKSNIVAQDSHINNEFSVIDLEKLSLLKNNVQKLIGELSYKAPNSWTERELEGKLRKYHLTDNTFKQKYIRNIRR